MYKNNLITELWLDNHEKYRLIYPDNSLKIGINVDTHIRQHPQTIGFVVEKYSSCKDNTSYSKEEYLPVFDKELSELEKNIASSPGLIFLIDKLVTPTSNKNCIYEQIIVPAIQNLSVKYTNIVLLY